VFISSQNRILYAVDPSTGRQKWQYSLHNNVIATPVVVGDFLLVLGFDTLYQFNVNTGRLFNKFTFGTEVPYPGFVSSPITDGRSLFLARRDGKIYSINPKDTLALTINWTYDFADTIDASIGILNGMLLVAGYHNIGTVNFNGSLNWKVANPGTGVFISSPVASLPYIYVGSTDYKLYAFDAATGASSWSFTTLGIVNSSPIVYGGNVIFGSADNYVYCLDTAAKAVRWKFKTQDRVMSSPAAYGQVVYIGGYDAYVYALRILDGELKWRFKTNALIQSSPVVQNGRVYISGYDKYLYAFDTSGEQKWSFDVGGPVETSPILYDLTKTYYPSITGLYQY
jgi:outer membrane protein assembly factor BamB